MSVCVRQRERKKERGRVRVCVCVCEREREKEREREREKEKEREGGVRLYLAHQALAITLFIFVRAVYWRCINESQLNQ